MEKGMPLRILFALLLIPFGSLPSQGEAGGPRPASLPLRADGTLQVSPEDRCPVCAMKVRAHARFASAIAQVDGTTFYFCGTGCMIRSWIHPQDFLGIPAVQLDRPVVQDYFSGNPVDARRVTWVAGSDIVGPMGPALVPVEKPEDLEAFKTRHGFKTTFRLEEMDDQKWRAITGKKAGK